MGEPCGEESQEEALELHPQKDKQRLAYLSIYPTALISEQTTIQFPAPFSTNHQIRHNNSGMNHSEEKKKQKQHAIKMNTVRKRVRKRNMPEKSENLCR